MAAISALFLFQDDDFFTSILVLAHQRTHHMSRRRCCPINHTVYMYSLYRCRSGRAYDTTCVRSHTRTHTHTHGPMIRFAWSRARPAAFFSIRRIVVRRPHMHPISSRQFRFPWDNNSNNNNSEHTAHITHHTYRQVAACAVAVNGEW